MRSMISSGSRELGNSLSYPIARLNMLKYLVLIVALLTSSVASAAVTPAEVNNFSQPEIKRAIFVLTAIAREKGELKTVRRPVSLNHPATADLDLLARTVWELQRDVILYRSPLVPLIIARHESGFRNLRGDHHLSDDGRGVSCGITQIRTDFEGRPRCSDLLRDPSKALMWTHNHLNRLMKSSACLNDNRCLSRYAGAGPKAREFEAWVYDVAEYVEDHLILEREEASCLPVMLSNSI